MLVDFIGGKIVYLPGLKPGRLRFAVSGLLPLILVV